MASRKSMIHSVMGYNPKKKKTSTSRSDAAQRVGAKSPIAPGLAKHFKYGDRATRNRRV